MTEHLGSVYGGEPPLTHGFTHSHDVRHHSVLLKLPKMISCIHTYTYIGSDDFTIFPGGGSHTYLRERSLSAPRRRCTRRLLQQTNKQRRVHEQGVIQENKNILIIDCHKITVTAEVE
jgi:hypothetical protein